MYMVKVVTEYRSFTYWVPKEPTWSKGYTDRAMLLGLGGKQPETITYAKDDKWYTVYGYNRRADEVPK
jgi:hypothetical protein